MTREQRDAAAETVGRLRKRARLFERLLDSCRREWKNTNDPDVLAELRDRVEELAPSPRAAQNGPGALGLASVLAEAATQARAAQAAEDLTRKLASFTGGVDALAGLAGQVVSGGAKGDQDALAFQAAAEKLKADTAPATTAPGAGDKREEAHLSVSSSIKSFSSVSTASNASALAHVRD